DLASGAAFVLAEGRESGTVGLYHPDGRVREPLVSALVARVPADRIIFEAPTPAQQRWFVLHLGMDVNLGNVATDEVIALETLRRGLRADTAGLALRRHRPRSRPRRTSSARHPAASPCSPETARSERPASRTRCWK